MVAIIVVINSDRGSFIHNGAAVSAPYAHNIIRTFFKVCVMCVHGSPPDLSGETLI